MARTTSKICSKCDQEKLAESFSPHRGGLNSRCKPCIAKDMRERRALMTAEERALIGRRHGLKLRYGMTIEDYNELYAKQDGVCAICKHGVQGNLHIDHDHETDEVRGLLCSDCNRGIGLLGDDHERLIDAAIYVMRTVNLVSEFEKVNS